MKLARRGPGSRDRHIAPYIIRVVIALFIVAAATPGESIILDADPIRRAHPGFVENLIGLGADVDVDWF